MDVEKITRNGKSFAVIPMTRFRKLVGDAEMLADVKAFDDAKTGIDRGDDEVVPFEIVERRVAGESPLKVWREHRGLTQEGLAAESGVSRVMIAAIESGHRRGGVATLKKLAVALKLSLDNLA
jgi:DNA-binding XRE family transcriptional regulator